MESFRTKKQNVTNMIQFQSPDYVLSFSKHQVNFGLTTYFIFQESC